MKQKGIESEVLLLSHLPRKYAFVFQENSIVHVDVESGWPQKFGFEKFDALRLPDAPIDAHESDRTRNDDHIAALDRRIG